MGWDNKTGRSSLHDHHHTSVIILLLIASLWRPLLLACGLAPKLTLPLTPTHAAKTQPYLLIHIVIGDYNLGLNSSLKGFLNAACLLRRRCSPSVAALERLTGAAFLLQWWGVSGAVFSHVNVSPEIVPHQLRRM